MTRFVLFLLALPLFAQTVSDPGQMRPCPPDKECVFGSKNGVAQWLVIDPASMKIAKSQFSDPFSWTLFSLSPAMDALTARVSTVENQISSLQVQQPVADVFVSTSSGQTFTPSATPKWGHLVVVRNGLVQSVGKDYNFSGGAVSFLGGLPLPNEIVRLEYWR